MKLNLYYAGYNNKTLKEQIGLAISSDFINWDYVDEPIIPIGFEGVFDKSQTSNPCVLKVNGNYLMYYQGKSKDGLISIFLSKSKDGIVWQKPDRINFEKEVIFKDGYREGFHHPHVIFDLEKNKYFMWFVFYTENISTICLSESLDGLNWKNNRNTNIKSVSSDVKFWYPFVMIENGKYKIWFTERKLNKKWVIHYGESTDGLNWRYDLNKPVIKNNYHFLFLFEIFAKIGFYLEFPIYGIGSPFIWKGKDEYNLIGHQVGPRGKLFIAHYKSKDGLNWIKKSNNILKTPKSSWNNFFQADPYIYVE